MSVIKATHVREGGTKVVYRCIRFEISKFELEYTIQRFLQEGWKLTKSGILRDLEGSLRRVGEDCAFNGLIDDDVITQEAVSLCKELFPSFY